MTDNNMSYGIEEKRIFVWVLIAATIAFGWILLPFAAPILWAGILAVLFNSVNHRLLQRFPERKNTAALVTLLVAIIVVVLPVFGILTSVVSEAASLFKSYESGEINLEGYIDKATHAFPVAQEKLASWGIDYEELKTQLKSFASTAANFITKQSLSIGQNTLSFFLSTGLMLYLAFFLLRDGPTILNWIKIAFPLDDERETKLFAKFSEVTRATVKGNLLVGIVQGGLGGMIFWILGIQPALMWAVVMAIASLIPAVGTALIWAPAALYLFIMGKFVSGMVLVAFGILVIGLVDNILRPILVGRDTKLPDYIVLLSTLGGLGLVGIHGFVVGPLIAALFFALWNMFVLEFYPNGAELLALDEDLEKWEEEQTEKD